MDYIKITFIYALYDKRFPDTIRYIGKSNNPYKRLNEHIYESKITDTYKSRWLRTFDVKKYLGIKILIICPEEEYMMNEELFISIYKSDKLTNSDDSGRGFVNRNKEIIEKSIAKKRKKVYRFDLDGNFIDEYKSTREAGRKLNINHSYIVRVCNGIFKHTNGFIFSYEDNKKIAAIKNPNAIKKKVIERDCEGNILNTWNSISECARYTNIDQGNISKVCNGKLKKIKNRIFEFKKEVE